MNTARNPASLAPPAARYSHGMVSSAGSRLLHTSGIVPTRPDGTVPATLAEQAERVWQTITALLQEGGFATADVVSVTTYVVPDQDLAAVMAARDRALHGHLAASTLVVVAALARPEWLVEIAVVAAATTD